LIAGCGWGGTRPTGGGDREDRARSGRGRRRGTACRAPTMGLGHGTMFQPEVGAGCTGDPRPVAAAGPKGLGRRRDSAPTQWVAEGIRPPTQWVAEGIRLLPGIHHLARDDRGEGETIAGDLLVNGAGGVTASASGDRGLPSEAREFEGVTLPVLAVGVGLASTSPDPTAAIR